jgi:hypothetical protein
MQTGAGAMPVMIQLDQMGQYKGFPYSPKATCGDCHNGGLAKSSDGTAIRKADGTAITTALVSYSDMSSQAFHSELGSQAWIDDTTPPSPDQQPWSPPGMWGKW